MTKFLEMFFGGIFYVTSRQYHLWLIAVVVIWFPLIIIVMVGSFLWDFFNDVLESLTTLFIKLRNEFNDIQLKNLLTREEFTKIKTEMENDWNSL